MTTYEGLVCLFFRGRWIWFGQSLKSLSHLCVAKTTINLLVGTQRKNRRHDIVMQSAITREHPAEKRTVNACVLPMPPLPLHSHLVIVILSKGINKEIILSFVVSFNFGLAHLLHLAPGSLLDRTHFAFAVAHGAQAAPHLAAGSLDLSALELSVVDDGSTVPVSIVCHG